MESIIKSSDIKINGVILSERKEDIKKKLENEKKLQEAIKKAKEKGIQCATQTSTNMTLTQQLNFKNLDIMFNQRILSLLGENDEISRVKTRTPVRQEFKELKDKIRNQAEHMVKTSEDIIERQRDEKAMKLFSTYKPFLKNHLEGDENNLFHNKRGDRDFIKEKKKCSLNYEGLKKKKLPKNIDKIIEIEEERTFGSNFYKKEKGKNAFSNYNESLYERICQVFENDYIEPCSITWDMEYIKNPNQDIPYYRELAPYAREIINIKENHKKNKAFDKISIDLLNEGELLFDEDQLNFGDIMNIISGRISSRLLHKILNRTDIHSLIDENEEIDEEFEDIQIVTEYSSQDTTKIAAPLKGGKDSMKNSIINSKNSIHAEKPETREKKSTLNANPIIKKDSTLNKPETNIEYTNDPKKIKDLTKKKKKVEQQMESGVQANEYDIFEESKQQLNKTDTILQEIIDIKEAKENTKQLPKTVSVNKLQRTLNLKLEENLMKLLFVVLDKDESEINIIKDNPDSIKDQIKNLIKNMEKLKGQTIDGHQKPKLLYKFLKEYKKLTEETEYATKMSNQIQYASFEEEIIDYSSLMTKSMNKSVNKSVRKTILKEESEEKPKQDKNKEIFQNSQRKNTPGWGEHKKNVFSNNLTEISKDDDDGAFNFRKIGSTPLGKQNKSKWNNEINNLLD